MITREQICSVCFEQIIPKWYSTPNTFPDFLTRFTKKDKTSNEAFLEKLIPELHSMLSTYDQQPCEESKKQIKQKLSVIIEAENILHIREHISKELFDEFETNTECFIERARTFDEALPMENIWQAMRNYFIYAIILNLQGKSQNCHDTILGYSLLYPYTDNYIDELHRKSSDKNSYNDLIRRTLLGEDVTPSNEYEKKTKQLLKLVLNSYYEDNTKQKEASLLLLLMLEAQEKSILQIHKFGIRKLTTDEILHISTYKGGLSVLLDYLFSIDFDVSAVTKNELYFYISFGFILQLADDLQDITEDKKKHSQTLLTCCFGKKSLEHTVNRLFHFTQTAITGFSPINPELHTFMQQNCQLMLLITIAQNKKYFSKAYLEKIEHYLPFSISFLQKMQKTTL